MTSAVERYIHKVVSQAVDEKLTNSQFVDSWLNRQIEQFITEKFSLGREYPRRNDGVMPGEFGGGDNVKARVNAALSYMEPAVHAIVARKTFEGIRFSEKNAAQPSDLYSLPFVMSSSQGYRLLWSIEQFMIDLFEECHPRLSDREQAVTALKEHLRTVEHWSARFLILSWEEDADEMQIKECLEEAAKAQSKLMQMFTKESQEFLDVPAWPDCDVGE